MPLPLQCTDVGFGVNWIGDTAALVFFLASATARWHFPAFFVQTALYSRLRVPGHSADTKEQKQLKTGSNFFRMTRDIITCRFNHYDGMAQPSPAETMVQGEGVTQCIPLVLSNQVIRDQCPGPLSSCILQIKEKHF